MGTVDILFIQVEQLAFRVFSGRYDAGGDIRVIRVIADPQQVLSLPDLQVPVLAHALEQIEIKPIPRQLAAGPIDEPAFSKDRVQRIGVFDGQVIHAACEIGEHAEGMAGLTLTENSCGHGSPVCSLGRLVTVDHVVHEVIGQMTGIDADLGQFRDNPVDAKGLLARLHRLKNLTACLLSARSGSLVQQVSAGQVAPLAIRRDYFEVAGVSLAENLYLGFVAVPADAIGGGVWLAVELELGAGLVDAVDVLPLVPSKQPESR